jgi:hypothetical protein
LAGHLPRFSKTYFFNKLHKKSRHMGGFFVFCYDVGNIAQPPLNQRNVTVPATQQRRMKMESKSKAFGTKSYAF